MADDELLIPGSKKKAFFILLIGIGFVAMGVFLIRAGEGFGWVVAGFFSLAIPIAIWMLLTNHTYLKLDRNGLEVKSGWKPLAIRWADVDEFYLTSLYGNKMVGIRYSSAYRGREIGRKVASAMTGGLEAALPDHFQASPEEICATLNEWRERFGIMPR